MPAKFVAKTRGPQAHPRQPGIDGELLDLFVPVAAETGRLPGEVVVGVDRRQRNQFGDPGAGRLRPPRRQGPEPSARELRNTADAPGHRFGRRADHLDADRETRRSLGVRVTARTRAPAAAKFGNERAADIAGRPGYDDRHDASSFSLKALRKLA